MKEEIKTCHGSPDNNVNEICQEFVERSKHGFRKYGVTTERNDISFDEWIQHFKEELQDALVYIHKIQKERARQFVSPRNQKGIEDV